MAVRRSELELPGGVVTVLQTHGAVRRRLEDATGGRRPASARSSRAAKGGGPSTRAPLPPAPRLILAPGAGAPLTSDFLQAFAAGLARRGITTTLFNFGYQMAASRKPPSRMPQLLAEYTAVVKAVRRRAAKGTRLFIGGKSMGGRVATMLAAEIERDTQPSGGSESPIDGLVLLGYPLHPAGRPDRLRSEHLPEIGVPGLFVSGTRDALAETPLMKRELARYGGDATLEWIENGDHSLKVRKRDLLPGEADPWERAMDAVADFIGTRPK